MSGSPCGLFVFIASSFHMRCLSFPYGNQMRAKVRDANQLIVNLVVLLAIAHSRSIFIVCFDSTLMFFFGAGYSLYIFQKRWSFAVFSKHNPLSHSQDGAACKQRALDFPWAGTISSGNRCCQNPQLDEMFWTPFTKTVRVYGKHHRGCAETVRADLVEKTPGKVGQDPNKHFTWYSRSTSDALEKKTSIWANDWVFLGASSRILYIYRLYI